jgi:hypothetical protein
MANFTRAYKMFGYNKDNDKEEMLRKIMASSNMVDPSQMVGMTTGGGISNMGLPSAPSGSMAGVTPGGAIDNTAATIDALTEAQTVDPAFLQAQQNAQSDMAMQAGLQNLGSAAAALSFNPGVPDMIPLQRGGGMMALPQVPDLSSSSSQMDLSGLLNYFK